MSISKQSSFYENSIKYWSDIPPTLDGVLGGFGFISHTDITVSKLFLESLFKSKKNPGKTRALDCGAGIGRITKYLLLDYFECVDVVEPIEKFTEAIKDYVGNNNLGSVYNESLQNFIPKTKYNVIWIQWVLGYLTNEDLITFFQRCRSCLSTNGIIIVKENVTSSGKIEYDDSDSSVTRPLKQFCSLFKEAGLKKIKQYQQKNFPKGIYPVYIFALVPETKDNDLKANLNCESTLVDHLQNLNIKS